MAFTDKYGLSAHAIITNAENKILVLKQTYRDNR